MALLYPPKVGDILICEFPDCLAEPEMIKRRPIVVVSPKLDGRAGLVGIVPISNTPPTPVCAHHCELPVRLLGKWMGATGGNRWAKCDMVYTFSLARLSPIEAGRDRATKRRLYEYPRLDLAHIQAVRRAVAVGLGIKKGLWPEDPA